jgi:hypothetical protein
MNSTGLKGIPVKNGMKSYSTISEIHAAAASAGMKSYLN